MLVVTASQRDAVLEQISARAARYERFDPETSYFLKELRQNVKDIFNKGLNPGDDIMEELYFLDSQTRDFVEKLTMSYSNVVTPDDFKVIANIMSEHLAEQVPILKDFTRFFGRLAEDFLKNAKPSQSAFDWKTLAKVRALGKKTSKGYKFPDEVNRILGLKAGERISEKMLKRFAFWTPNGSLSEVIYGVDSPEYRRTGKKILKFKFFGGLKKTKGIEILEANKLPKKWTNVPWVNFDGQIIEQNFTQKFQERLVYKDEFGNWITNIMQVPQKTEATWWEQVINESGKINDIADATKARTAFAVNGNHSNDATIVKNFHLWGRANDIPTSTIHDAFFTNAADMIKARKALRELYARALKGESVLKTLKEMRSRGLPKELYVKYLKEAVDKGIIPIVGKSRVGGRLITKDDILTAEDILKAIPAGFENDFGWYGVN